MNDKPLDRYEVLVFNISHFYCEVKWHERKTHSLTTKYIEVKISYDSPYPLIPLITKQFPVDLTLREIKQRVATLILEEIEKMKIVTRFYYASLAREKNENLPDTI